MKTHKRVNENLFKSMETAYNIRVASKFEAADCNNAVGRLLGVTDRG